jgi:hypothetical protein
MQNAVQMAESEEGLSAAEFGRATVADLLRGYESFLQQATVFAYLYGDEEEAAGCFGKLQDLAAGDGRGDDPMKERTWTKLAEPLAAACAAEGFDPQKSFPPPPGAAAREGTEPAAGDTDDEPARADSAS